MVKIKYYTNAQMNECIEFDVSVGVDVEKLVQPEITDKEKQAIRKLIKYAKEKGWIESTP